MFQRIKEMLDGNSNKRNLKENSFVYYTGIRALNLERKTNREYDAKSERRNEGKYEK